MGFDQAYQDEYGSYYVDNDGTKIYTSGLKIYTDGKIKYPNGTIIYPDGSQIYYGQNGLVTADDNTLNFVVTAEPDARKKLSRDLDMMEGLSSYIDSKGVLNITATGEGSLPIADIVTPPTYPVETSDTTVPSTSTSLNLLQVLKDNNKVDKAGLKNISTATKNQNDIIKVQNKLIEKQNKVQSEMLKQMNKANEIQISQTQTLISTLKELQAHNKTIESYKYADVKISEFQSKHIKKVADIETENYTWNKYGKSDLLGSDGNRINPREAQAKSNYETSLKLPEIEKNLKSSSQATSQLVTNDIERLNFDKGLSNILTDSNGNDIKPREAKAKKDAEIAIEETRMNTINHFDILDSLSTLADGETELDTLLDSVLGYYKDIDVEKLDNLIKNDEEFKK